MEIGWAHLGTSVLTSFLASLVECVEALTVVLAVGSTRGWRAALGGSAAALALLVAIISLLGRALLRVPIHTIQLIVGSLLLLFGLRWLRKAILRSAGLIPFHDERAAFISNAEAMRNKVHGRGIFDGAAFAAAFNITMLEGTEVVFIVIGIGAGGMGMLLPASLGAVAALLVVIALGVIVHRPLAKIPENTLKFIVGILLSGFGTFWTGEGMGLGWPGADWSIVGLAAAYLILGLVLVPVCRSALRTRDASHGLS
jgi:Ca2+/H+ antiporter, TMEM165/GDT1 family